MACTSAVRGISLIISQLRLACEGKHGCAAITSELPSLSSSSFRWCLQQNSITLTLPYNGLHPRGPAAPRSDRKKPNYSLTLTRSLSLALTSAGVMSSPASLLLSHLHFTTFGWLFKRDNHGLTVHICSPAVRGTGRRSDFTAAGEPSSLSTPQLLTSAFNFPQFHTGSSGSRFSLL